MTPQSRNDDEPMAPEVCGHYVAANGAGFHCVLTGDHGEHVWRGEGQASRGLGSMDRVGAGLEVRWRDPRPAATVGDARRALAKARSKP